ncbi:MAG: hypothetical protein JOY80_09205 [Candidatus Dormibacteraeota bacterium]|nr:hypothetical protein [Candidatus Dormibacteraeota bacterium]
MPTKLRRIAITETPRVASALAELRREPGGAEVPVADLLVLGAERKLDELRSAHDERHAALERVAERIRTKGLGVDPEAADYARRHAWTHD